MQVKINKRKGKITLIFIITFCLLVFLFFFLKEKDPFNYLFNYCSSIDSKYQCTILISNLEKKDSTSCLELIMPSNDIDKRNLEICVESNILEWENPYGNYKYNIPVDMVLTGNKNILGIFHPNHIAINVIEDEKVSKTFSDLVDENGKPIGIITSKLNKVLEKNYVLNTTAWLREGALEPELMDELLVFSSQISDYQVEGEEIVFKILLNVYGTKVEKTVRTKKLIFESVNLETDESSEREIITAESDLSEYLDLSKNYNIGLIALDEPAITQEMVEDYINGYGEYDFTLESLTRYD
jgi:hypothetical protein